jgi:hypothetical protein
MVRAAELATEAVHWAEFGSREATVAVESAVAVARAAVVGERVVEARVRAALARLRCHTKGRAGR